ncbi:gamma-glutamylcyclotransferase [Marinobacter sp. F4216]|uniref:gamma-glutamylcyclotransferase family protein n=1 Tax=Marinobacter sp. F4216 TaxID=2874281 RepID=UPI001CBC1EEA|nr:gamma-glutamylcyclotransferase family protein [Marinobacter sp. F4216]MBZ2167386.1 gamma-glutamylcyclotransferase [Marinobacter sp. F4216]
MEHLVAVYGTLKRGFFNSHLLEDSAFIGEDTLRALTLFDLGAFPGALLHPSAGVLVEVFSINEHTLRQLDILEAFVPEAPESSLYLRQKLPTRHGLAWTYIYNGKVEPHQIIASGIW